MAVISIEGLSKHYKVPTRDPGLRSAVRSLFKRTYRTVKAVEDISFTIEPGEVVGFLGPNGAGKTTTLKMLSGLLFPTCGRVEVLGYEPSRRQAEFLQKITLVMGNRNQLAWDLPAMDSFDLQRSIYNIPHESFIRMRDDCINLLDLKDLVHKPVRNLSLGERMKMEFVGSLLHQPRILFLDEPTIGLDVTMQRRIRTFVAEYNQRYGATVLLTSHYMADIEALCRRVIVIHHGQILFDGELNTLKEGFSAYKKISLVLERPDLDLSAYGEVIDRQGNQVTLRVERVRTSEIAARLLSEMKVIDLSVEDPPVEDVIEHVFAQAAPAPELAPKG